ncbi:unnamed protein product [Urochloa humidicola]
MPPLVTPSSSLSPDAAPFYPAAGGRTKFCRWADDDGYDSDNDHPTSYLDAARRPAKVVTALTASAQARSVAVMDRGGAVAGQKRKKRSRRRKKRGWPRPQLVCGMPARPVEGRTPTHLHLGHRGRVSAPNADGWQEILPRQKMGHVAALAVPRCDPKQLPQAQKTPAELHGRCLNCLSYSHRVAICRMPRRCLRCHGFRHLAKDCKRPRPARGGTPPASQHTPHGAPPRSDGVTQSVAGGVGGVRRRRARRRSESAKDSHVDAAFDHDDCAATTTATLCFPVPDPLALELWTCTRPPEWVDPMLEEFVASLTACQPARSGCPLAMVASQEDEASDIHSPAKAILSPAEEAPTSTLAPPSDDGAEQAPRLELSSPDDGPEFPPGFELGFQAANTEAPTPIATTSRTITESASAETAATVVAPEVDHSAALEAFINNVTKDIPAPLIVDKPPRRRRVDPVLVDAPPLLPSSDASVIRRSYCQALDPLSAVKPARRGEVVLMRRLGEVGVPLHLAASAEQAVKQFFLEGPPPHQLDAMSDMFPMLKNKTSPYIGLSAD